MSENPYSSPQDLGQNRLSGSGMVGQVQLVSIFMIVQGSLCVLMGLIFLGYAAFFPIMMNTMPLDEGDAPPETMIWMMMGVMLLFGLPIVVSGILQIYAGIRNLKFRSRILGIVALISNAVGFLTCYCAPTGLALLIFGLIVYFNQQVIRAFKMVEEGATREDVLATFLPYYAGREGKPLP